MPLLAINNLEELTAGASDGPLGQRMVELPGTGFDHSFVKFKPHGCCEVLGYQLASRLGISVIPSVPVWCPRAFAHGGGVAEKGRIGLAIKYLDTFEHLTWEQAASLAPETVAASLVLCLLDRYEWGQFADTKFGLVFYDLERLFPAFPSGRVDDKTWCDVADDVSKAVAAYRRLAASFVQEVLDEAAELGLTELLRSAVADAATISTEEFINLFDLKPHPLAMQISKIAADVCVMQFRYTARLLSV